MSLWDEFDSTMFDKLDEGSEEDFPAFFVLLLIWEVLTDECSD